MVEPIREGHRRGPQRKTEANPWELTTREMEIVQRICRGEGSKEISRRMEITDRTLQSHLAHIFEKVNVGDRVELILAVLGDVPARKRCFPKLQIIDRQ